jgi:hypothetical protein
MSVSGEYHIFIHLVFQEIFQFQNEKTLLYKDLGNNIFKLKYIF